MRTKCLALSLPVFSRKKGRRMPGGAFFHRMKAAMMYKTIVFLSVLTTAACAVDIAPGQNWNTIVRSYGPGTTYIIKAGRHVRPSLTGNDIQSGDKFIGEDGAIMDGENQSSLDYAFQAAAGTNNVEIRNLEITGYTPREQYAVIECSSYLSNIASGWIISDCVIHHNDGAGLRVGDYFTVTNNYIHHQQQIGIVGGGTGSLVENNEIAYCNWQGKYDGASMIEEGGAKFAYSTNIVVRNNYAHHNRGPGLWTDINNTNSLYIGNRCDSNAVYGIFHEISYSATICCNICIGNGVDPGYLNPGTWGWGSGIMITNSSDVDCYGNIVVADPASGDGIVILQQVRTDPDGRQRYSSNNHVHHNDVTYAGDYGCSGWAVDDQRVKGSGNRFDNNRYRAPSLLDQRFLWHSTDDGSWFDDFATMQARGQELHGYIDGLVSSRPSSFPGCSQGCTFPTISFDPVDQSVNAGEIASFSVMASGSDLVYQWKRLREGSSEWENVGTNANAYSYTVQAIDNNAQIRCEVSGICGPAAYSRTATVYVCAAAVITSNPSDATVAEGATATFTVVADGSGLTYQWQKNSGSGWTNVTTGSGSTSATYSFTAAMSDSGTQYRCVVTGSCGSPATSAAALLKVNRAAPSNLTYSSNPASYIVHTAIAPNIPSVTGTVTSYSVTPSLPAGLLLNAATGVISGTPTAASPAATYTVTAANSVGSTSCGVVIEVAPSAEIIITYRTNPATYYKDIAITPDTPSVSGPVDSFTISGLPRGLAMDKTTGIISGTPAAVTPQTDYTVTGYSGGAATTITLTITVIAAAQPPSDLSYAVNPAVYIRNKAIVPNTASVSGIVDSFRVSPSLPAGLSLNKSNGTVSGTPTTATARRAYTVIAANSGGADTCELVITVVADVDTFKPNNASILEAYTLGPTAVNIQWTTPESDSMDADSVFVFCMTGGYPGPGSAGKIAVAAQPVSSSNSGKHQDVTGLQPATKYYFSLWVTDALKNISSIVTATATTDALPEPFNPIIARGMRFDSTRILLTLTAYSSIASTIRPYTSYVDTVGVWYDSRTLPAAPQPSSLCLVKFALNDMKAAGDTFTVLVNVGGCAGSEGFCHIAAAPFWHAGTLDTIAPFVDGNGDMVLMSDTSGIRMRLSVSHITWNFADTSITFLIDATDKSDSAAQAIGVWYGQKNIPDFTDTSHTRWVDIDSMLGQMYPWRIKDPLFAAVADTIYFVAAVRTDKGTIGGFVLDSVFITAPPPNPVKLSSVEDELGAQYVTLAWEPADTVRIWYGRSPVPLHWAINPQTFDELNPPRNMTSLRVWTLNPQTLYHFGLQTFSDNRWTAVTESSSVSITTKPLVPSHSVINGIVIDSARFERSENRIIVAFHQDETAQPWAWTQQAGIAYSLSSAPTADTALQVLSLVDRAPISVELKLREPLMFDTIYHIGVFMRDTGALWAAPTPRSSATVFTGEMTWMAVNAFFGPDTQATLFNGRVILEKTAFFQGVFSDTLLRYDVSAVNIGDLVDMRAGIKFAVNKRLVAPIRIGIVYGTLPLGVTPGDLQLYRVDSTGALYALFDSYISKGAVWVQTNDLTGAIVLLADTVGAAKNTTARTNLSSLYICGTGKPVIDTFLVNDIVTNIYWRLLVSRGGAGDRLTETASGYLTRFNRTIITHVPAVDIDSVRGMIALLVLFDGVNRDTIPLSRQVARSRSDPVSLSRGRKWYPLYATAELDNKEPCAVLAALTGLSCNAWYTKKDFRLIRWLSRGWVEYDPQLAPEFAFEPGRLIWLCTASPIDLDLGKGKTVNMQAPASLTVPAGDWLDFGLPYKFPIKLADILNTSGGGVVEALRFYKWRDGSEFYSAEVVHAPGTSGAYNRNAILTSDSLAGYTVYNPASTAAILRIPPVSSAMSAQAKSAKNEEIAGSWGVAVQGTCGRGIPANTVICGFEPTGGPPMRYYPAPPSFAPVGIHVYDEQSGRMHGYATATALENGEGVHFNLCFANESVRDETLSWKIRRSASLSGAIMTNVLNPESGEWIDAEHEQEMSLDAGAKQYRVLVVGAAAYLERYRQRVLAQAAALLGAWPNPFTRIVRIRYMLPYADVRACTFTIYDASGRMMWRASLREFRPGASQLTWDGRTNKGRQVAAGVYLLRMAVDYGKTTGKKRSVFEQRLTYIR